jgi:hypothetical protein
VFKGETLRGLLLNAYAFGTVGTIAGIATIGAFIAAAVMLVLSGLGLLHARRVSPEAQIFSGRPAHARTPATASSPQSAHPGNQMGADDGLVAARLGTSAGLPE